ELRRLLPNGALDKTFHKGGIERSALGFGQSGIGSISLALEPNGAILASGYAGFTYKNAFALYTPNGFYVSRFGASVGDYAITAGRLTIASYTVQDISSDPFEPNFRGSVSVTRFSLRGRPDTHFFGGALVVYDVPGTPDDFVTAHTILGLADG